MYTPQQLQQITFDKAVFGGYDMESVDEVLEPLINDYEALFRENATLKSKMRVLVEKLEEYRKNEGSVQEALRSAQRTCDSMVRDAEKKCLDMLHAAQTQSAASVPAAAPVVNTEDSRPNEQEMETMKAATMEQVAMLERQLMAMEETVRQMKAQASESTAQQITEAPKEDAEEEVAREIAENLERIVGTTEDKSPVAPRTPGSTPSVTSRFTNMDLQFGKNYDPTKRR